jgi:hypothetical protein
MYQKVEDVIEAANHQLGARIDVAQHGGVAHILVGIGRGLVVAAAAPVFVAHAP